MQLFDSHTHLNAPSLLSDLDGVLARAVEAGVCSMAVIGYTLESSRCAVELAQRHSHLHAVVGIAPHDAHTATDADWDALVELARSPGVVGIGETGFEGHYHPDTLDVQRRLLDRHTVLARELGFPLVIHLRAADDLFLRWAEQNADVPCIMHCFSGGPDLVRVCLEAGFHISFAGSVTFKNAKEVQAACAVVPLDRLLIETDCPYLAPGKYRGRRPCEPHMLVETARAVAVLRGASLAEIAAATTANSRRIFGLR